MSRPDATQSETALIERQLQMLGALAEIGLEIARAVEARAKAPGADVEAAAMAYARVARAVRQSILLQTRLIEGRRARDESDRRDRIRDRMELARRVRRIIGRMADDVGEDAEVAEAIGREAAERLDSDDIYGEVLNRPVGELVALICRDLGIEPDWSLWSGEAWASGLGEAPAERWSAARPLSALGRALAQRSGPPPPFEPPD